MLPTVDGRLFAIKGGNFQLAVKLLAASQARVRQPKHLTTIERANGTYYLHSEVLAFWTIMTIRQGTAPQRSAHAWFSM